MPASEQTLVVKDSPDGALRRCARALAMARFEDVKSDLASMTASGTKPHRGRGDRVTISVKPAGDRVTVTVMAESPSFTDVPVDGLERVPRVRERAGDGPTEAPDLRLEFDLLDGAPGHGAKIRTCGPRPKAPPARL